MQRWPNSRSLFIPSTMKTLTALVSERFYRRLEAMVSEAEQHGAVVLRPKGYEPSEKNGVFKMPLTVVLNPPRDGALMREEIFGPVLPVLTYEDFADVPAYINQQERPPVALLFFQRSPHGRSAAGHNGFRAVRA